MRRVLASVLCGVAASSLAPAFAEEAFTINPNPIFMAMPAPASMPTIVDMDNKQVDNTKDIEAKPRAIAQNSSSDASATPATPAQPTGSFPKTGIGGQFEKIGRFGKMLPKRLPPTLLCAVGGTPIAFFRRTVSATQEGVKDIVGESKFPLFVAPAICVSFPYGLCAGVLAGPVVGLANGWKYSDDKPFSKDAFSLGTDK